MRKGGLVLALGFIKQTGNQAGQRSTSWALNCGYKAVNIFTVRGKPEHDTGNNRS